LEASFSHPTNCRPSKDLKYATQKNPIADKDKS